MTAIETFTEKFGFAVKLADSVARAAGYGEPVTDQMRLRVVETLHEAAVALAVVANEVEAAAAKASPLIGPDAGVLAQRIDTIRKRIADTAKNETKARQAVADRAFTGRG